MSVPFHQQIEQLDARIDQGIHDHRMSDTTVRVADAEGRPVVGADVQVEQTSSNFLFGANIFMLGGYPTEQENERYAAAYCRLFNAASVPLYWRDLEPEPGRLRFAADSEPIHRRPPPDMVVDFGEENGLNMNGHCLVWDNRRHSVPPWYDDLPHKKAIIERRIREIAERYGERIQRWDIVNEPVGHYKRGTPLDYPFPAGYEDWSFACANRFLPETAFQMINETTVGAWHDEDRPFYRKLIDELIDGGARIDGIGLQWHHFSHESQQRVVDGDYMTPEHMLGALDEFIPYDKPLHISEITIHSVDDDAAGRAIQAELARDTYRLWFSHPAVHAITWWNVPDGGAVLGEDKLFSGLIDKQLNPKPAFEALNQLINHDWRTNTVVKTDGEGVARFRGFHGHYELRLESLALPVEVASGRDNQVTLTLPETQ